MDKRYIVLPASKGFFVLQYRAPERIAEAYRPLFDKVAASFQTAGAMSGAGADAYGRKPMAEQEKQESSSFKMRRSLSQLSLVFAAFGLVGGIAVMSPDGRFAGFSVMALCGAVPLVLGPSNFRKYGALAAVAGTVGVILIAGSGESSLYRTKARLQAVHEAAVSYCEASADHRTRTNAWPAGVDSLDVPKKPRTVTSVSFGTDGSIAFILSFPPVKDGALVFIPSGVNAPVTWTCRGSNIPEAYLPDACREK